MKTFSFKITSVCLSFITLFGCVRAVTLKESSFTESNEGVTFKRTWEWKDDRKEKDIVEDDRPNIYDAHYEIWKKKQKHSKEMMERNNLVANTDFVQYEHGFVF